MKKLLLLSILLSSLFAMLGCGSPETVNATEANQPAPLPSADPSQFAGKDADSK